MPPFSFAILTRDQQEESIAWYAQRVAAARPAPAATPAAAPTSAAASPSAPSPAPHHPQPSTVDAAAAAEESARALLEAEYSDTLSKLERDVARATTKHTAARRTHDELDLQEQDLARKRASATAKIAATEAVFAAAQARLEAHRAHRDAATTL